MIGAGLAATGLWALAAAAPLAAGIELPDNPLAGRLLFESRGCYQCHGIAGAGAGIGPDLGEGHFTGSFLDLGAAMWNHVPGMTAGFEGAGAPWPELSSAEVTELTAFLYFIDYLGRPGVAAAGERLFAAKGCGSCHALEGRGTSVAPDLTDLQRFASPLYIAQAIWNHGPSMFAAMAARNLAPPSFATGDLADLSAFLRRAAREGPQESVLVAPGNPNRGRELFSAQGCSTCHGAAAAGGDLGPDLRQTELHRSAEAIAGTMWNHAVAMEATMRQLGISWPIFTTEELADVVAFLYFLPFDDPPGRGDRGAEVFAARGCAECHTPTEGAAEPPGPELFGADAIRSPAALVAAMWNHAPIMKEAILAEGRPWPELEGEDLRDLLAFLTEGGAAP